MARETLSFSLEQALVRRVLARAADQGVDLSELLGVYCADWVGEWGKRVGAHRIAAGETLWAIARRYYGDGAKFSVLAAFNGITDPTALEIGQIILIPEPPEPEPLAEGESPYLYGLHDRGGEQLMEQAGRPGWVLVSDDIGCETDDASSEAYDDLTARGFGVIVRINNGYTPGGSIPHSSRYADFAVRCSRYVAGSSGCHIWVIGNEPNLAIERPGGPLSGEIITPQMYADCFRQCAERIHAQLGHENDQVVTAAIGPWNTQTTYASNPRGDWVQYFADVLTELQGIADGISLHTYGRSANPDDITSEERMRPPFENRRALFRSYMDFMEAVPETMRHLPAYLTETDQNVPWEDANRAWVQRSYQEIAEWNASADHQKIRCMVLYRWKQKDIWSIDGKNQVVTDLKHAMARNYRWDLVQGDA